MEFDQVGHTRPRMAVVVGDKLSVIGKPVGSVPTLQFNVTTQPAGSNIFNGLGSSGSNVALSELDSATFAQSGYYRFTADAGSSQQLAFEVICWPAAALTVDRVQYASAGEKQSGYSRPDAERRGVLRSLAAHCTKAGAQAALEGGAATAPSYGTSPVTLAASTSASLAPFGGW